MLSVHRMTCSLYSVSLISGHFPWGVLEDARTILPWRCVPEPDNVFLTMCPWRCVPDDVSLKMCPWRCVPDGGSLTMCPWRCVPDDVSLIAFSWIFRPLYIPPQERWVMTDVSRPRSYTARQSSSALGFVVMMHVRPNAVAIRSVLGAPLPHCEPFLSTRRVYLL
jgi:hypothetical protein